MSSDAIRPALHLPERYLAIVQDILRRCLPHAEVWAYGSRVNGDHYDASDLDLVVRQPDDLTRPQPSLDEAAAAFSESDLPILVQIVDWARIPEAIREEIEAGYVVLQPADAATATPTDAHSLAPTLQRGRFVGPLQRPVSSNRTAPLVRRDVGASQLAHALERGIQTTRQGAWMAVEEGRRIVGDYVRIQRGSTYQGSLVGAPGPPLLGLGSIQPGGGFVATTSRRSAGIVLRSGWFSPAISTLL